jgi:nucleoredoxin
MMRIVIAVGLGFILIGGIYVFCPTIETAANLVFVAKDVFFPSEDDNTKKAAANNNSDLAAKPPHLDDFAAKFNNTLMVVEDGKPQNFDVAKLAGVKYYAFYYSASWCSPCRAFTPDLVSFYRSFKPFHPEFELIFVNLDHSESEMLDYMNSDSMKWPAIWYADIDNPGLEAKKYCGSGIPCLVLVDNKGRVLSDTFAGGQYTDPHHVIDDIRAIVQ